MRIFVTGAAGRLGRLLVRQLVASGAEVVGLVSRPEGAAALDALGAKGLVGRLRDEDVVSRGARGARVLYHLAGGVRGAGADTAEVINHEGTRHLLAALHATPGWRQDLRALVFSSSVAVYGDRSGLWVDEQMPPHPNTLYGKSKVAAENILLAAAREEGLPARVVRVGAVYGPGFGVMMDGPIRAGRAWLPGEGRNYVPSLHCEDTIAGLLRVGEAGGDGQIYNLADPNPVTQREFYATVARLVGGRPPRFWSTWVPSYLQHGVADRAERLQARLGRRPRVTPDTLKLYTASVRMKVERLEKELGFVWKYPTHELGLAASLGPAAERP